MWYDRYDEDDLDNHHPICKGGCNQLADECMCNYDFERGVWKTVDTAPVDNVDYDEDAGWVSDHLM